MRAAPPAQVRTALDDAAAGEGVAAALQARLHAAARHHGADGHAEQAFDVFRMLHAAVERLAHEHQHDGGEQRVVAAGKDGTADAGDELEGETVRAGLEQRGAADGADQHHVLAGVAAELKVTDILMRGLRVQGIYVGSRDMFETMNRAISQHGLKPVIDLVFPFDQVHKAYEYLHSGQHFGKVVIQVG